MVIYLHVCGDMYDFIIIIIMGINGIHDNSRFLIELARSLNNYASHILQLQQNQIPR